MKFKSLSVFGAVLALARFVSADCECGYSINKTTDGNHMVLTEIFESDFTTLQDIRGDRDWRLQSWKITKEQSRGPYGRQTLPENAVSNPIRNPNGNDIGKNGRQSGLELYVRKLKPGSDTVSVVEADSVRDDMLYGSYRAGIKVTGINGTCGAFFWYLNDTQEIDMEFLSRQLNDTTSPVNLVLHSPQSLERGGDASGTDTFKVYQLPFEANKDVHEYRFDWTPGKVSFYADGNWLWDMTEFVPTSPGHIVISHWSNGHPDWSGGPPAEDAVMLVQYVKAYFNSSAPGPIEAYKKRCKDPKTPNAVCQIPDQKGPPKFGKDAGNQKPYFFSQDPSGNKTKDQYVWGEIEGGRKSAASSLMTSSISGAMMTAIIAGVLAAWV